MFFFNDINSLFYFEYLSIFIFLLVTLLLIGIVGIMSYTTSVYNPDLEKLSTYECGFDPYESSTNVFDIKFYLIAIIFLVFDIETTFILPWSVSVSQINLAGYWSMIDFIIELNVGYIYLWFIGAINWD